MVIFVHITSPQGSTTAWLGCPLIPIHPEEVQHSGSTSATIAFLISLLLHQENVLKYLSCCKLNNALE